jgi:hypothetical protein
VQELARSFSRLGTRCRRLRHGLRGDSSPARARVRATGHDGHREPAQKGEGLTANTTKGFSASAPAQRSRAPGEGGRRRARKLRRGRKASSRFRFAPRDVAVGAACGCGSTEVNGRVVDAVCAEIESSSPARPWRRRRMWALERERGHDEERRDSGLHERGRWPPFIGLERSERPGGGAPRRRYWRRLLHAEIDVVMKGVKRTLLRDLMALDCSLTERRGGRTWTAPWPGSPVGHG